MLSGRKAEDTCGRHQNGDRKRMDRLERISTRYHGNRHIPASPRYYGYSTAFAFYFACANLPTYQDCQEIPRNKGHHDAQLLSLPLFAHLEANSTPFCADTIYL
ncbi:hypothetical protein KQX54_021403 [Cotesia glomerata]|uniref:Uncharacterized protein n=1 Tax=Cotesia glomerata TaxID=32391 RepID=A0AAV7IVW2_COTGL|nr:hypothetical protein KQX54_021403 [Cotesia glomerata]